MYACHIRGGNVQILLSEDRVKGDNTVWGTLYFPEQHTRRLITAAEKIDQVKKRAIKAAGYA